MNTTALTLPIRDLATLLVALEGLGFEPTYELPHERARFINSRDMTVAVGFDGTITAYGDAREREALIAALGEVSAV